MTAFEYPPARVELVRSAPQTAIVVTVAAAAYSATLLGDLRAFLEERAPGPVAVKLHAGERELVFGRTIAEPDSDEFTASLLAAVEAHRLS